MPPWVWPRPRCPPTSCRRSSTRASSAPGPVRPGERSDPGDRLRVHCPEPGREPQTFATVIGVRAPSTELRTVNVLIACVRPQSRALSSASAFRYADRQELSPAPRRVMEHYPLTLRHTTLRVVRRLDRHVAATLTRAGEIVKYHVFATRLTQRRRRTPRPLAEGSPAERATQCPPLHARSSIHHHRLHPTRALRRDRARWWSMPFAGW